MAHDAKKKSKEKQESLIQQPWPFAQNPFLDEQELIQETNTLKLTPSMIQSISSTQRIPVPFTKPAPAYSGSIVSTEQKIAVQLRLMTPRERAEFKCQPLATKSTLQTRSGSFFSPLRPSETPYEKVRKVVNHVMGYLNLSSATAQAIDTENEAKPSIVKVVLLLDEYVESISRSVSDEEMEAELRDFQRDLGVDDEEVSWYSLMKISNVAFWNSLADHFIPSTFGSDSQTRVRVIRNPESEPAPVMNLLPSNKTTFLRPRPNHRLKPDPDIQMGPPEPRMNYETPYETVKKALTFLKSELELTTFDDPNPNPSYSVRRVSGDSGISVEEVVMELDEYVNSINKTSSSCEMKALLMLFQKRLGLPTWPSIYNLVWFSALDFLDHLGNHLIFEENDAEVEAERW